MPRITNSNPLRLLTGILLVMTGGIVAPPVLKARVAAQETARDTEERGLTDDWETFRPAGMEAGFQMPKAPKLRKRTFTPVASEPPIVVRLHSCVLGDGDMMFVAGWHDLHQVPKNARMQKDVLDGAVRTSVANVMGSRSDEKPVKLERYPGRQVSYRFTAAKQIYRVIERVYLVGARQYQFRVLAKVNKYNPEAAERFFESVELLDPDNDLPPRPRNRKPK